MSPIPPSRPPYGFRRLVALLIVLAVVVFVMNLIFGGGGGGGGEPEVTSSPSAGAGDLSECNRGAEPAPNSSYDEWQRTLVDNAFELTRDYEPPDLVSVTRAGFRPPGDEEFQVRRGVMEDLAALRAAAFDAGNPFEIVAAYRNYKDQAALFHERKNALGTEGARAKTAAPGHSEHQLGTTIDFKTKGASDVDATWEKTPAGAWMAANAGKFGFVMSYPRHAQNQTCYVYEPWHYRYFGVATAREITESGLTTREYLWQHRN